jgi:hypothetical protein
MLFPPHQVASTDGAHRTSIMAFSSHNSPPSLAQPRPAYIRLHSDAGPVSDPTVVNTPLSSPILPSSIRPSEFLDRIETPASPSMAHSHSVGRQLQWAESSPALSLQNNSPILGSGPFFDRSSPEISIYGSPGPSDVESSTTCGFETSLRPVGAQWIAQPPARSGEWEKQSGWRLYDSTAESQQDFAYVPHAAQLPWLVRIKNGVKTQIDPKFVLSVLDVRELIIPLTSRRLAFLAVYAGAIAGLVVLNEKVNFTGYIAQAIRFNNFILMGIIYGVEPIMMMLLLCVASLPPLVVRSWSAQDVEAGIRHPSHTENTALIIPCHNSDPHSLRTVLRAALIHFDPKQIFIIDNGEESRPPTDTRGVVGNVNVAINYIWSSIGSKNAAQFIGAMAARNYDNIMTIDDDVSLPHNFVAPDHRINDQVKAVAFPVEGSDSRGLKPLFVGWQDAEYKFSGLAKEAEASTCGVMYPHGAGCFWDRQTLCDVLRLHDLIFIAEDVKMGLVLQQLNKRMEIESGILLNTEVPETLAGASFPNYWQQRVRSWEMGRHLLYWHFTKRLFSLNGQNTVSGFAMQKVSQSYALASNGVDWLRVPLYVAMGGNGAFWWRSAVFWMAPTLPLLLYKYSKCRKRPDLAPSLTVCVTFPAYKIIYSVVSFFGALRSVAYWWPAFKAKPTIPIMEKSKDIRAIWLDPRFVENPNFLLESPEAEEVSSSDDAATKEMGLGP